MQNRLAIGTAQFGHAYGIANRSGQVSRQEARKILHLAMKSGIDTLDTAIAYGESEQVLGKIGVGDWSVITKLPQIPDDCQNVPVWIRDTVDKSLERLRIDRLTGLLLHKPLQLLEEIGPTVYQTLIDLKRQKLVEKIGYSVYTPDELNVLWQDYPVDVIQMPANVLDSRFRTSGWLARLYESGAEIHARSIFLQGLLLMNSGTRPAKFHRWQQVWQKWDGWLAENQLTPLHACVGSVLAQPEFHRIVVGVDSVEQFCEILEANKAARIITPTDFAIEDDSLVNPSRWGQI